MVPAPRDQLHIEERLLGFPMICWMSAWVAGGPRWAWPNPAVVIDATTVTGLHMGRCRDIGRGDLFDLPIAIAGGADRKPEVNRNCTATLLWLSP